MENYHYIESGLDNIYLANGFDFITTEYGPAVSFADSDGLHDAIGASLLIQAELLTGAEYRFIRKELGYSQQGLADILGFDLQTPANWEKGKCRITTMADACLRKLYDEKVLKKNIQLSDLMDGIKQPALMNGYWVFEKNEFWQVQKKCKDSMPLLQPAMRAHSSVT